MIEPVAEHPKMHLTWQSIPFFLVHIACIAAFWLPFSWGLVAFCFGMYFIRMFAITAGFHRYFSHRTFKTSRAFQFILALLGTLSLQKGPLWWAAHHRHHHRHSDRHGDLHSPGLQGFLWAHVGWILTTEHNATDYDRVRDLAQYPELVWLNKFHLVPGIVAGILLVAFGGWEWLVWGLISTVITWHATFAINSLTHMIGRRRYKTKDDSRNSWIMALITLGEGWHNNHHYYKSSTRQGFFWWEIDITYYILRLLALFGVVWNLKEPSAKIKESNRIDGPEAVAVRTEPARSV
ncbi:MAG: fatty acid desaturase [Acidobacteriota bacterium]